MSIGGYVDKVVTNETIQYTSDIPENYVEDGTAISDNVINSPILLSMDGEISETYRRRFLLTNIATEFLDKTQGIVNALYPNQASLQALQKIKGLAINADILAQKIKEKLVKGEEIYDDIKGRKNKGRQQDFVDFLETIHKNKTLVSIQTPLKLCKNMRITALTIIRDNTTEQALKFKLQAKEVRFAKTTFIIKDKYFPSPSNKEKITSLSEKGTVEPKKSALYKILE